MIESYLDYKYFGKLETIIQNKWRWKDTRIEDPNNPNHGALFNILCPLVDSLIKFSSERRNVKQNIFFCILDTDIENAAAIRLDDDNYCIIVSSELFTKVIIFGGMIEITSSIKSLFPKISESALITDENYSSLTRSDGYPVDFLEEAWSRSVRGGIGGGAFMAIIFHELGHIINGHCGYTSNSTILEQYSDSIKINKDDVEIIRALEYDADCFAMQEMLNFQISPRRFISHICDTIEDGYRLSIVSTLSAFGGFGRNRSYDPNWINTNITHPHPIDRIRLASAQSINALSQIKKDENVDDISSKIVVPATSSAIQAFAQVAKPPISMSSIKAGEATYIESARRAEARWANIRPKLMHTKLGTHNLAPPVEWPE